MMSAADISTEPKAASSDTAWQDWLGREESFAELIAPDRVEALAATLDIDAVPTERLPPGWHWIFFNRFVLRRALGHDGHPQRGGFLPPVPLPRRMWAGGRLTYLDGLQIGRQTLRQSRIAKIETKPGRAGLLVFVTVVHRLSSDGREHLVEEQDIVYRGAPSPGAAPPSPVVAPTDPQWTRVVQPDTTLLFRYSALTGNGHRIHYDQPYARDEEGYPDLVVHGPLTATLLQNFAGECRPNAKLHQFEFRGAHPLFVSGPITLGAKVLAEANALDLWAQGPGGVLAMRATARFG